MTGMVQPRRRADGTRLASLRNVGKAALADFAVLGIATVADLATRNPDDLYIALCTATGQLHDPCVHDVFAATIHEARTGEAMEWWTCTAARKARQAAGTFPHARQAGAPVIAGPGAKL